MTRTRRELTGLLVALACDGLHSQGPRYQQAAKARGAAEELYELGQYDLGEKILPLVRALHETRNITMFIAMISPLIAQPAPDTAVVLQEAQAAPSRDDLLQSLVRANLSPTGRIIREPRAPQVMRIGDGSELPSDRECPDGGACHHGCVRGCFRVARSGPLSGAFPGDVWPAEIVRDSGDQDGVL